MKKQKIRILFLGDSQVGKTSIILSIISDNFPSNVNYIVLNYIVKSFKVEKVLDAQQIPADFGGSTSTNVNTYIVDSCNDENWSSKLNKEIDQSDAILLVYDVSNQKTVERLSTYWLPKIQSLKPKVPVIIVGNKIDLKAAVDAIDSNIVEIYRVRQVILPLIKHFRQVQIGLECSAIEGKNMSELIYCAQRAVLYPLNPLYNTNDRELTTDFKKALKRIFIINDLDNDGILNDKELTDFQRTVFNIELQQNDIQSIKEIIKKELNSNENNQGINLEGFLCLQKKCIEMMKIQTCWTILRHYRYNNDLRLMDHQFKDDLLIEQGASVELSDESKKFLEKIFIRHSQNKEKINQKNIQDIFEPDQEELPVESIFDIIESKSIEDQFQINFSAWKAFWDYLVNEDYKKAYKHLKYIGLDCKLGNAFKTTKAKQQNYQSLSKIYSRDVIRIYIIGHYQSGKTNFLYSVIGKLFDNQYLPTLNEQSVSNYVEFPHNKIKCLIFTEIPESQVNSFLENQNKLQKCDILCIFYSNPQDFKLFNDLYSAKYPEFIPKICVRTQIDKLNPYNQLSANSESIQFGIQENPDISVKQGNVDKIYESILNILNSPSRGLLQESVRVLQKSDKLVSDSLKNILIILTALAGTGLIYLGRKYYLKNKLKK